MIVRRKPDLVRTLERLAKPRLSVPPTPLRIIQGVAEVTIEAQGGYATVTHGAGFTPANVQVTPKSGAFQVNATADSYGSTTFRLGLYRTDGSNVGTIKVAWMVID